MLHLMKKYATIFKDGLKLIVNLTASNSKGSGSLIFYNSRKIAQTKSNNYYNELIHLFLSIV